MIPNVAHRVAPLGVPVERLAPPACRRPAKTRVPGTLGGKVLGNFLPAIFNLILNSIGLAVSPSLPDRVAQARGFLPNDVAASFIPFLACATKNEVQHG